MTHPEQANRKALCTKDSWALFSLQVKIVILIRRKKVAEREYAADTKKTGGLKRPIFVHWTWGSCITHNTE